MRLRFIPVILLIVFFSMSGCSQRNAPGGIPNSTALSQPGSGVLTGTATATQSSSTTPAVTTQNETKEPDTDALIRARLNKMTLDEKIGQLLFLGLGGKTWTAESKQIISGCKPGGIVLLGSNVQSADQLQALVKAIRSAGSQNTVPLFISVDEEGGRVSRMPPELIKLPSSLIVGSTGDAWLAARIGAATADKIKAFGFNMDFAPVLDIFSNPKNTVIGDRAFGTDPNTVKRFGIESMEGLASGVVPVIKHFPGHGDTTVDSHKGLPIVNYDIQRLKSFELIPFQAAIDDGADAVMIAHILLPKLDPDHPSSLSKPIVTGLLREQMHFNGVVITDDLTMGAIKQNYGLEEAAKLALKAGCDMLLIAYGKDNQTKVFNSLKTSVLAGEISIDRVDESVFRILKLKDKYKIENTTTPKADISKINQVTSSLNKAIAQGAHQ